MHAHRRRWAAAFGFLLVLPGCAWVPKGDYMTAESRNRALTEQTRAQLAEIENLKAHNRQLEDQLMLAEEELALLDRRLGRGSRSVGRPRTGGGVPAELSRRLDDLSHRYPSLSYDPATGISKLDTDVLFDTGDATMRREAEQLLAEFAEIFRSPEASQLRIMVVGHTDDRRIARRDTRERHPSNWHLSTARALAVSDYLRELGVPEHRMGVAGFGEHQPVSTAATPESRRQNRRVEIYVMGPETPVVGWTESVGTRR